MRAAVYLVLITLTACLGSEYEHEPNGRAVPAGPQACRQSSDCPDADDACHLDGLSKVLTVPLQGTVEALGHCAPVVNRARFTSAIAGAACTADNECASEEGGRCIKPSHTGIFPGGYCTGNCTRDADCGEDALCASALLSVPLAAGRCLKRCESESSTRPGA